MAQKIVPQKNKLSDLDFKKVIISLDDASGILGIQIKNKHNFIILVLSITIAIDCAVTIYGDFFVSPYNEELLLQLGNMAYFILNEKRQYLVSTINCHRINGIFLLFNHLFMDDYTWMDEANDLFYQIHPQIVIRERFYTTMKNLKIACYLNQVFFALFQNTTYILTYILVYPERLFIPSCIVYNYVTQVYSFIQIRFILQFYIICDMCTDIVRQANEQIVNALESSNLEQIHQSLTTFGIVCQIVNRLNHHLKRIYIIYLTCSLAIIVPLLHAILYTGSTWIILLSLIALLTYYIFLIGYLSHIAGKVDQMAYDSGNKLYQMMISEQSLNLNQKLSLKFKVQQYCDQTLANVIGLSFLGNAINTQTCIKLITTFLTMLALLMSRYKKIDYYITRLFTTRRSSSAITENSRLKQVNNESGQDDCEIDQYKVIECKHVPESKWEDVWSELIEAKHSNLKGIVFLNPNFSRTFYVPLCGFRCDFESFAEYGNINLELLSMMKNGRYEQWMQSMIRADACFVPLHVCSPVKLLDRLCSRCPNLSRLSMHFYYLEDQMISYLIQNMANLESLNLENSIGLTTRAFVQMKMLKRLAHLNLSSTDLSELSLTAILDHCTQLVSLDVSNNCAITGHCLSRKQTSNLKRLNIRDCWAITSKQLVEIARNGSNELIELLCNSGINDESLEMISTKLNSLQHLDISFEEFTYHDDSGYNLLTTKGFSWIAKIVTLRKLRLRHIGRLSNKAMGRIIKSCNNLTELTLNLRHRHKLTDNALQDIARHCPNLKSFEAVHNHFIGTNSLEQLSGIGPNLQHLILRGNELIHDVDAAGLIKKCTNLRVLNLDGCRDVGEKTLTQCILHARNLPDNPDGTRPEFIAGLVNTSIERTTINELQTQLPENLRIRVSNQQCNKVHYNEFDGKVINELSLRDAFFPFYWHDFN